MSLATTSAAPITSKLLCASVLKIPRHSEEWRKLPSEDPMAQLHAKFWGVSLAPEVETWRNEQQSTSDHSDEISGGDIDEDEDDDIIPGCCILNLNSDAIEYERIWVRVSVFRFDETGIVLTKLAGRLHPDF
jgi:hypothetical protein